MVVGPEELAKRIAPLINMDKPPQSLGEFRSWWNRLHGGYGLFIPNLNVSVKDCSAFVTIPQRSGGEERFVELNCVIPKDADGADLVNPGNEMVAKWNTYDEGRNVLLVGQIGFDERGREIPDPHSVPGPRTLISAVVKYPVVQCVIHENFLENIYSDWHTGTFAEAFPELASVSRDFGNIDLEHVLERVRDLPTRDGQKIEILGLKIPYGGASRWGGILLIAVQLYFWLHLSELTRRISEVDAAGSHRRHFSVPGQRQ